MRYFGITAQHCLRTRTRESVRLELDQNRGEFLPLKQVHLVESHIEHDWDFSDLAFFEVESKLVSEVDLLSNHFLDIGYFINLPLTAAASGRFGGAGLSLGIELGGLRSPRHTHPSFCR